MEAPPQAETWFFGLPITSWSVAMASLVLKIHLEVLVVKSCDCY